jgi:hypothetical protein
VCVAADAAGEVGVVARLILADAVVADPQCPCPDREQLYRLEVERELPTGGIEAEPYRATPVARLPRQMARQLKRARLGGEEHTGRRARCQGNREDNQRRSHSSFRAGGRRANGMPALGDARRFSRQSNRRSRRPSLRDIADGRREIAAVESGN